LFFIHSHRDYFITLISLEYFLNWHEYTLEGEAVLRPFWQRIGLVVALHFVALSCIAVRMCVLFRHMNCTQNLPVLFIKHTHRLQAKRKIVKIELVDNAYLRLHFYNFFGLPNQKMVYLGDIKPHSFKEDPRMFSFQVKNHRFYFLVDRENGIC